MLVSIFVKIGAVLSLAFIIGFPIFAAHGGFGDFRGDFDGLLYGFVVGLFATFGVWVIVFFLSIIFKPSEM